MFRRMCSAFVLVLSVGAFVRVFAQCSDLVKAEENGLLSRNGSTRGSAVIFGEAVTVPELRLRFVDAKTGTRIAPKQVIVTYPWKWLEYPYPEHPWGAWSDAYDFIKCALRENAEEVVIPEYKLVPRGWYKGKYTDFPWSRKPKFDGIGITVEEDKCMSGFGIKKSDLDRYRGAVATVRLSCPQEAKVSFSKP
jgi:hypothetical protein